MLYTWIPINDELIWSSYTQGIKLSIEANKEPSIESFIPILKTKLLPILNSFELDNNDLIDKLSPFYIANCNEKSYSTIFINRIINNFPDGWQLIIT